MAAGLSNLASLLMSPYAQGALQGTTARDSTDAFKTGTSITARYTVDEDGALALRDVNINEPSDDSANGNRPRFNAEEEDSRPSTTLASLARPRAVMNPSDEVALFAGYGGELASQPAGASGSNVQDAVFEELDADGNSLEQPTDKAPTTVAAQKQTQVANLYARNADVIYNVDPIMSDAA